MAVMMVMSLTMMIGSADALYDRSELYKTLARGSWEMDELSVGYMEVENLEATYENVTYINSTGDIMINGTSIGDIFVDASGDTMTGTLNSRSVIPTSDNSYNLGSSTKIFDSLYVNEWHGKNFGGAGSTKIMTVDGATAELSLHGKSSPSVNKLYPLLTTWDLGYSTTPTVNFRNIYYHGTLYGANINVTDTISGANLVMTGAADSSFTGSVGIGTTSPSELLHVNTNTVYEGAQIGDIFIGFPYVDNTYAGFKNVNWPVDTYAFMSRSTGQVYFNSASNQDVRFNSAKDIDFLGKAIIKADGNVGIGTSSPSYNLEVESNLPTIAMTETDTSQLWRLFTSATHQYLRPSTDALFRIDDKDANNIFTVDTVNNKVGIGTTSPVGALTISGNSNQLNLLEADQSNKRWDIHVTGTDLQFTEFGVADRMQIASGGNVGIGTTSPSNKFHMVGPASFPANLGELEPHATARFQGRSGTDTNLYISEAASSQQMIQAGNTTSSANLLLNPFGGYVGIGTTSPDVNLDIESASTPKLYITDTTTPTTLRLQADNSIGYVGTTTNHPLRFQTAGSTRMIIGAAGKVGIGTTNPATELEIEDTDYSILTIQTTDADSVPILRLDNDAVIWDVKADGAANDKFTIRESGVGDHFEISKGGAVDVAGDFTAGTIQADNGFTGTFTNGDGDTVTVAGGIITDVS
jgi:hypothetical protein